MDSSPDSEGDSSILAANIAGFVPRPAPAMCDQRVAAQNLHSFCVIDCAAHRVHPERQPAKGAIYESSNVADNIGRCTLCSGAMHVIGRTEGVGPECNRASSTSLQPVPAWYSAVRFESRASQGATRSEFRRNGGDRAMARAAATDPDR